MADVSLEVKRNEFVCLVGPSGCGKSTLLRLVAGLVAPTGGAVVDRRHAGERAARRHRHRVPGADLAAVGERARQRPVSARHDAAGSMRPGASARANCWRWSGCPASRASIRASCPAGMQQRAGICRALVHDPDILLMDEPFGALDALTREELTIELMRIWQRAAEDHPVRHAFDSRGGAAGGPRGGDVGAARPRRRDHRRPRCRAHATSTWRPAMNSSTPPDGSGSSSSATAARRRLTRRAGRASRPTSRSRSRRWSSSSCCGS